MPTVISETKHDDPKCPDGHPAKSVGQNARGEIFECNTCRQGYRFIVHNDAAKAADKAAHDAALARQSARFALRKKEPKAKAPPPSMAAVRAAITKALAPKKGGA
jgi:hypothetical protein